MTLKDAPKCFFKFRHVDSNFLFLSIKTKINILFLTGACLVDNIRLEKVQLFTIIRTFLSFYLSFFLQNLKKRENLLRK